MPQRGYTLKSPLRGLGGKKIQPFLCQDKLRACLNALIITKIILINQTQVYNKIKYPHNLKTKILHLQPYDKRKLAGFKR